MVAGGGLVTMNNPLFNPFIAFSFAFFEMKLQHAQTSAMRAYEWLLAVASSTIRCHCEDGYDCGI